MDINVTPEAMNSIPEILESSYRHGITINDICSFDKEFRAWNTTRKEGAQVLNMVMRLANDTGLDWEASKRVLWYLCREWELEHIELVAKRESAEGYDEDLKTYIKALEYSLSGNEVWSMYTQRYNERH